MAEIRTTSATGGEKGVKPERHDLIPVKGVAAIARVFGFGAQKYADHNWRKKYEWGKSLAALNRHIDAFADGETYDPESGLPHLAHAGFHILVLLTWLEEDGEGVDNPMDDRWPAAMERAKIQDSINRMAEVATHGPDLLSKRRPECVRLGAEQVSLTVQATNVKPETFALATGIPVEDLRI